MSTTTRVLDANVNGTVYTVNANSALEALDTCHSGATAPTDEVANGKLWLDTSTTPAILKIYNDATWEVVLTASTATASVTAAGAVMDSELTDIAAVKALNQGVASTDSPTFAALGDGTDTVATGYVIHGSAKAWALFNANGTASLDGSFNTSSLTDQGVGAFLLTWTNAMSSSNYASVGAARSVLLTGSAGVQTASTVRVATVNSSGSSIDDTNNSVAANGDIA